MDNLIYADAYKMSKANMQHRFTTGIEAIFVLLGEPDFPAVRIQLCGKKMVEQMMSYLNTVLDHLVEICLMEVTVPPLDVT